MAAVGASPKMAAIGASPKMAASGTGLRGGCRLCEAKEAASSEGAMATNACGPPSLSLLCGRAVSAHMGALEDEVWVLPGPILQGILPLLNIYYLERIEETAAKKGLSTQAIWHRLWDDVMKTRPTGAESVACWRTKFLEAFFAHVLRGTLDLASDRRLHDRRFSPLLLGSRYVTQLTVCNMLQGVAELVAPSNRRVLDNLAGSLRTLKFRHLLFSDLAAQRGLRLLLHRLIHHGAVGRVAMYSWPVPETSLFLLILTVSAGFWQPERGPGAPDVPCGLCEASARAAAEGGPGPTVRPVPPGACRYSPGNSDGPPVGARRDGEDGRNPGLSGGAFPGSSLGIFPGTSGASSVGTSTGPRASGARVLPGRSESREEPPLPAGRDAVRGPASASGRSPPAPPTQPPSCKRSSAVSALLSKPRKRFKPASGHGCPSPRVDPESNDLYDFVFIVGKEEEGRKEREEEKGEEEEEEEEDCVPLAPARGKEGRPDRPPTRPAGPGLGSPCCFRSVSALELFTVPLSTESSLTLCRLLGSWVTLETLTLSYNGLGSNIFHLLDGLRALSRRADCRLHTFHLSDLFSPLPVLELVSCILRVLPRLRALSVRVDHPSQWDGPREEEEEDPGVPARKAETPENSLQQLEVGFPRGRLQGPLLRSVFRVSRSLQRLSLDSAVFQSTQEFRLTLQTLREWNPRLKSLSLHDMNLSDCQKEVLFLLQNPALQEVTFAFCRLLEKHASQFLQEFVAVLKANSTLKGLRLPGNRLGNSGLLALADVFNEDSRSTLCQLDISSNCIKPDALLSFAKRLEASSSRRGGQPILSYLCLFQNWLDQDPALAQEATRRLRATCVAIGDVWTTTRAFTEYIGAT
ncbi:leucine-rich repeat-containing protein 41 isoform X1 [Ornithorhynchus anatinus]|uniref:leucine-rich repeat-containing protein 41 isoform X1 n=1 Tax=Ornithorhynchus anatinus TaxID=9258 RepID=UPI0010A7702B|nr:leucine-rich repeat-containing protein 41 isoform X1 [Ornithorhynchus anatinus]